VGDGREADVSRERSARPVAGRGRPARPDRLMAVGAADGGMRRLAGGGRRCSDACVPAEDLIAVEHRSVNGG
jgi:hypothetical protein